MGNKYTSYFSQALKQMPQMKSCYLSDERSISLQRQLDLITLTLKMHLPYCLTELSHVTQSF